MAVIRSINEIKVSDFKNFCVYFGIKTNKKAGKDGFDEELILGELNKIPNEKWGLNFIDDSRDGYFLLQLFE